MDLSIIYKPGPINQPITVVKVVNWIEVFRANVFFRSHLIQGSRTMLDVYPVVPDVGPSYQIEIDPDDSGGEDILKWKFKVAGKDFELSQWKLSERYNVTVEWTLAVRDASSLGRHVFFCYSH